MMSNIDPADFDRMMEVNTTGTFNCIHAALPVMRQKGAGLIVNIVSLAGKRAMLLAGMPYCVSKFATSALGTFVNLEECGNGIKVTNIYPGETNTPIVDKRPSPPPPEKRAKMLQPEDIAACVVTVAKLPARAIVPELIITPTHMMIA
jgi:NADP-dependent 3-hydroxy acid dehydrogenase YdfG